MNKKQLEESFRKYDFDDFKWITGKDIVVNHWVRFKCIFMCNTYGTKAVCPPNMPSIDECKEFFMEYNKAVILRKEKVADNNLGDEILFKEIDDNLLNLEREIFLSGYYKAMSLPMTVCYQCSECTQERTTCRHKDKARPNPEALGVDVFETVKKVDYPIYVLTDCKQKMNRYAILLIE